LQFVVQGKNPQRLSRFGNICKNEVVQLAFDDYRKMIPVHNDNITEVKMHHGNESLAALMLPEGQGLARLHGYNKQGKSFGK
jgi:hypothetical protein